MISRGRLPSRVTAYLSHAPPGDTRYTCTALRVTVFMPQVNVEDKEVKSAKEDTVRRSGGL